MEQEILILTERINQLEQIINLIVRPDRYVFERPLSAGAKGLKLGKTTTELISVYGVTPIAQAAAVTAPSGGATVDSQARTAIGTIITDLKNFGITA